MPQHEEHYQQPQGGLFKKGIHLDCVECGTPVPARDININTSLAKCTNCDSIFDFEDEIRQWDRNRPEIFMPDGLEVLKLQSELDIQVSWMQSKPRKGFGFLTFFTFMWNLILLPIVFTSVLSGEFGILLGAGIHIVVGLGLLGYIASVFVNTTDIIIDSRFLEIRHRPIKLPFFKTHKIPSKDIKQLYVTRYVSHKSNNVPSHAYALYAILHSGEKIQILNGMNQETQLYLEQEIENYLEIKDSSVTGEI